MIISYTLIAVRTNKLLTKILDKPNKDGGRTSLVIPASKADDWMNKNLQTDDTSKIMKPYDKYSLKGHPAYSQACIR